MHAMDTDGVNYDYGELPPEEEFPVTDEKVLAVLAMMQSNETARALAELPEDPEPSAEVFRLGYKMAPARRAAAATAAAAARAPALRPADVSAEAGNAHRGAGAALGASPRRRRRRRARSASARRRRKPPSSRRRSRRSRPPRPRVPPGASAE